MNNIEVGNENDIVFYEGASDNTKVEVRLLDEDVWLNTGAISTLFNVDRSGIVRHINNIYIEQELQENSTCAKIAHVCKSIIKKILCYKICNNCTCLFFITIHQLLY